VCHRARVVAVIRVGDYGGGGDDIIMVRSCLDILERILLKGVIAPSGDSRNILAWKLFAVMDTDMDMRYV